MYITTVAAGSTSGATLNTYILDIETGSATWRDYDMSLEHEPDRTERAKDLARVEAADKRAAASVIELVESMRKRVG